MFGMRKPNASENQPANSPGPEEFHSIEKRAAQKPNLLEGVTAALTFLKVGEQISIDTLGAVHTHKTPFISKQATPVATIRKTGVADFEIFSGLPPQNETFGISFRSQVPTSRPLNYSMRLKSGDFIQLADTRIAIPNKVIENPSDPIIALEQKIAQATVGDFVVLGRIGLEISRVVSRLHATVKILERNLDAEGNLSLVVNVFPGLASNQTLLVKRPYGDEQKIYGKCHAQSGTEIIIGTLGVLKLPHPPGSPAEQGEELANSCTGRSNSPLATCMGQDGRLLFSQQALSRERGGDLRDTRLVLGNALEQLIHKGLQYIKRGEYQSACHLMNDSRLLEMMGYTYSEGKTFRLNEISEDAIRKHITLIASESWFEISNRRISPSFGIISSKLTPKNEYEKTLLEKCQKEIALINAEEFTHALQDWLGTNVSRKAALLPANSHEGDIAVFFHEQGVNLSYEFVANRYSERKTCLEIIKGYQSETDQRSFSNALHEAPIGSILEISPSPPAIALPNYSYYSPSWPDSHSASDQLAQKKLAALAHHGECSAKICKNFDGSFTLAPSNSSSQVFAPDRSGYYSRVTASVTLEPGTPFYVGKSFKFVL